MRTLKIIVFIVVTLLAACLAWLVIMPPELLKVGSGYSAKMVCSNAFLVGRDPEEVLAVDVQAPGNPLLRLMRVDVDRPKGAVTAALLGFVAPSTAVYRSGVGCAVSPDGALNGDPVPQDAAIVPQADPEKIFPEGEKVEPDPRLVTVLANDSLAGAGMRAMIVAQHGRILGERYGAGFSAQSRLIGWSMAKTVNAALVARLVGEGKLAYSEKSLMPQWRNDERGDITLAQLLAMESGLSFNENYGTVADVTRMLFLEADMAGFAADAPVAAAPGAAFSYSSGTSILLSKIWMDRIGNRQTALSYPREALFAPIGMRSAVFETDAAGTFAGSSYLYATARDWTRFGMLLAADGVWNGERLLPAGTVAMMGSPSAQSNGRYSQMQTWLKLYGRDAAGLPSDMFMLSGHDGQTVAVVPSKGLVVVRLGLTPSWSGYNVLDLVAAAVKAAD